MHLIQSHRRIRLDNLSFDFGESCPKYKVELESYDLDLTVHRLHECTTLKSEKIFLICIFLFSELLYHLDMHTHYTHCNYISDFFPFIFYFSEGM